MGKASVRSSLGPHGAALLALSLCGCSLLAPGDDRLLAMRERPPFEDRLELWLDASRLERGAPMRSWSDAANPESVLVASNANARVVEFQDRLAVSCEGGPPLEWSESAASTVTLFAVFRAESGNELLYSSPGGIAVGFEEDGRAALLVSSWAGGAGDQRTFLVDETLDRSPHLITIVQHAGTADGYRIETYLDGLFVGERTVVEVPRSGGFRVCDARGEIAEIALFRGTLERAERLRVEEYLQAKWNCCKR